MTKFVDVSAWAARADIGETVVYWQSWACDWNDSPAHLARGSAMLAHMAGDVFLAQRRVRGGVHKGQLQYEATRIGSRVKAMLNRCQVMGTEDEEDGVSYVRVAPRRPRFMRAAA